MFDQLGMELTDILAPWIAILISISAAFWFKDFAVNLMSGLKLKFNPMLASAVPMLATVISMLATVISCWQL